MLILFPVELASMVYTHYLTVTRTCCLRSSVVKECLTGQCILEVSNCNHHIYGYNEMFVWQKTKELIQANGYHYNNKRELCNYVNFSASANQSTIF